jgi:general stress protein 26
MEVNNLMAAARAIIQSNKYCMLMTHAPTGAINARLMQPFPPDHDLTLWFGTSPRSGKVRDLRANPHATVVYQDNARVAYVTLQGTARLENDLNLRKNHWFEGWKLFWPDGPEGDDYILIRFMPEQIEIMNFAENIAPPPYGLMPAVLTRRGDQWVLGEHYREG